MNTLTFEKGLTVVDRATLTKSASYELAKGVLPLSRPIPHHQLLTNIIDMASTIPNVKIEEENIYATEGQSMRVMWPGKKEECPVENYLIQRLTTRIQLKFPSDTDMNMAIGVSYNEKGITMAMGPNVWACANQNVFGDNIMHTFGGNRKMPFDKMMEVYGAWIANFQDIRANDYALIESMKQREINENGIQLLYGKLIDAAVQQNMNSKVAAPLNQTQVADFIRASHSEEYATTDRVATVWDLQQRATSILKPRNTDLITIYDSNNNFNKFLLNEFQLN